MANCWEPNFMRRGKLICITGIDGSGKTTLAKSINNDLKNEGLDSIYVYGRVVPIVSRFFMILGRKVMKSKPKDIFVEYDKYTRYKKKVFHNSIIAEIYKLAFLLDQSIVILVKIMPRMLCGKIVICDRYVYDTIITDLSVDLGYSDSQILDLTNKAFSILPKPNIIFLIDIQEEIAFSRKHDVPHLNYLRDRRMKYLSIAKSIGAVVLDGSNSSKDVLKEAEISLDFKHFGAFHG